MYVHILKADGKGIHIELQLKLQQVEKSSDHDSSESGKSQNSLMSQYHMLDVKYITEYVIDNILTAGNFTETSQAVSDGFYVTKQNGGIMVIRDG